MKYSNHIQALGHTFLGRKPAALTLALTVLAGAISAQAQAQSVDGKAYANTHKKFSLEEIIVTARKTEENLQDVPISVTAFSAGDIESRSISYFNDIAQFTPNMEFATGLGGSSAQANVFIRGIGQLDLLASVDPGVGMYVDGVYLGRALGGVLDLLDVESVEVLRGPQGTLFGKNTIGGAINVRTARPTNELGGKLQLTAGRFGRMDALASVNLPLVEDTLAARLSFATKNRDGYGKSLATGQEQGADEDLVAKGTLLWTPSDDFELQISADVARENDGPISRTLLDANPAGGISSLYNMLVAGPLLGTAYDDRWVTGNVYTNYDTSADKNELDVWGVSATATWQLNDLSIKSITAYRNLDAEFNYDIDHSPLDLVHAGRVEEQNQLSQELQFFGDSMNDQLHWLIGLYYFEEEGTERSESVINDGLFEIIGVDLSGRSIYEFKNTSYAVFAQTTYQITEKLSTTVGGRYSWDTKDLPLAQLDQANSGLRVIDLRGRSESWENFSPKVGVEYRVNDDLMIYGSIDRGYRSGGFNGRLAVGVTGISYDPEIATAYQVGVKSQWLENRMQLNAAAYFNDYTDIHVVTALPVPGGFPVTVTQNAAKAEIQGFEAEFVILPAEGLELSASVGYIDAQYTKIDAGVTQITRGAEFSKTPEWSGSLGAQYSVVMQDLGVLTLRGDMAYKSGAFQSFPNEGGVYQDSFNLVNMRMGFEPLNANWQLALFVTNLEGKEYFVDGSSSIVDIGLVEGSYGRPREWGITFNYNF